MSNDSVTLSPAAFHILITLAAGNRHGYAIMKEVAATTAGQVQLNPGTLYTTIKRLLDEELIRETTTPSNEDSSDQRRRYYGITLQGRRVARAELVRLRGVVRHAATRLCEKPAHT